MRVSRWMLRCCVGGVALLLAAVAWPNAAQAQEGGDVPSDSLGIWNLTLATKLSASQAAYSNWTEGGINTLALTAGLSGKANRRTRSLEQTYDLRLALGFIDQEAFRKAEDLIKLAAALQYEGEGFFATFNPTVAADARTQFASGFNYDEVPPELQREGVPARVLPVEVSAFMNPGTFTQTVGLTYDPSPWFTQRFGVSTKETVVTQKRLQPIYGLSRGDPLRFEAGLATTTELDREVFENVRLKSTLGTFTALDGGGATPDVTFENIVTMQVNQWLGVDFAFTTLYDRDISDAAQIKEALSVGVTYVFI
jgi:hypothetical protein